MTGIPAASSRVPAAFFPDAFWAYGVGLTYWDLASDTLIANERFAELTGIGPGEVEGARQRWLDRVHPDDREGFIKAVEQLSSGGPELHVIRRWRDATEQERWVEAWVRPLYDEGERPVALIGAFADVTGLRTMQLEREEQGEWVSRLQRVTAALAVAGDVNDVVEIVAGPVADAVGGKHASVRLLTEEGDALVVAGWTGPSGIALPSVSISEETPIAVAARTGEAIFDWTIGDILERFPEMREQARAAGASDGDLAVAVPLRAPHRVIGVLAVTVPQDVPFTEHRREFLLAAASQAAQVVERARAFEAEQRAHRDADSARGRVEFLSEVTEALTSSSDVDETLQRLARIAVPRLADWCFVELLDGGEFRSVAISGSDEGLTGWASSFRERFSPTGTFYGAAIAAGEFQLYPHVRREDLESVARSDEHLAGLLKLDPLSSIVAPIVIDGEPVGLINLITGRQLSGRVLAEDDLEIAKEVARRAAVALDNAMLHTSERTARLEAEEVARRVTRLQRFTSALAGAVRRAEVVEAVLTEAVGMVGARGASLYALEASGTVLVGEMGSGAPAHLSPLADPDGAREARARQAGEVAASRTVLWIGSPEEHAARWPDLTDRWQRSGERSCAVVPLFLEERVVGVFYLGFDRERPATEEESEFLLTLGRQCAQALERARLYEEEEERRSFEAKLRQRIQNLHAITQAGLEHLRLDDSLHRMLELVVDAVRADAGAILLLDEDGRGPALRAIFDELRSGTSAMIDRGALVDVSATPLEGVFAGTFLDSVDVGGAVIPPHPRGRLRSVMALPLRISGRVLGSLHVGSALPGRFGADDLDLVRLAAEQVAIAADRAQLYEREHRIAEVLQRSLLPERLPEIRGMQLAARYLPGSAEAQVGGDWYEVMELPDGSVAMAVGDVVGSGVPAAATMGQFRNSMRALALEGLGVARVLERLNELALGLEGEFATALLMALDPASGMVRYASAGHPPALVVRSDGQTVFLEDANATPLGVEPGTAYIEAVHMLEPGDTLVLYTDGLVERRDESLDRGLERLRAVAPGGGDVEAMVSRLLEGVAPLDVRDDDIAIMALRYAARPARFELSLPPVAASIGAFRTALGSWLAEQGISEADVLDLTLAVSEVCSNAVEHAGGSSAEVELVVELRGGDAMVSVKDGGRWRPASVRPERGRGFLILRHVMDSVEVRRRAGGTEVRMHRRVASDTTP